MTENNEIPQLLAEILAELSERKEKKCYSADIARACRHYLGHRWQPETISDWRKGLRIPYLKNANFVKKLHQILCDHPLTNRNDKQ